MRFSLFRKKKVMEMTMDDIVNLSREKINENERRLDEFIDSNYPQAKSAVSDFILEVESLGIEFLHPRLRGVAKNFVSAMKSYWNLPSDKREYFYSLSEKSSKLAVSIGKNYRILFAVNPPELEGVNTAMKKIFSLVNEYNSIVGDRETNGWRRVLRITEEIREMESKIEKEEKRLLELNEIEVEDNISDSHKNELKALKEELSKTKKGCEKIESKIQKVMAITRKPIRIYAHMVGENIVLNKMTDIMNPKIKTMAEKTLEEVVKGSIRIKDSQRKETIESLKYISSDEPEKMYENLIDLKKRINDLNSKIKTLESIMKSKDPEKLRREIEKEKSSVESNIQSLKSDLHQKMTELKGILQEILGCEVVIK
jgi:predicted  nucleic acid-binding Zn-ribbon protein